MSGRNGNESFDFSKPFSSTVEVEIVSNATDNFEEKSHASSFEERFENAKKDQSYSAPQSKKNNKSTSGVNTWGLTIFLLILFCGLTTYTLVNYHSNQVALQDSRHGNSSIAGVRNEAPVRITGEGYSVVSEKTISKDFIYINKGTEKIEGVERLFSSSSVLIQQGDKKSGIVVLQQEQIKEMSTIQAKSFVSSFLQSIKVDPQQGEYTNNNESIVWTSRVLAGNSFKKIKIVINSHVIAVIKMFDDIGNYSQDVQILFDGIVINR